MGEDEKEWGSPKGAAFICGAEDNRGGVQGGGLADQELADGRAPADLQLQVDLRNGSRQFD